MVDEPLSLSDAIAGLESYKEVDRRMAQLWRDVDRAVVGPRTDIGSDPLPGIRVDSVSDANSASGAPAVTAVSISSPSRGRLTDRSNLSSTIWSRYSTTFHNNSRRSSSTPYIPQ